MIECKKCQRQIQPRHAPVLHAETPTKPMQSSVRKSDGLNRVRAQENHAEHSAVSKCTPKQRASLVVKCERRGPATRLKKKSALPEYQSVRAKMTPNEYIFSDQVKTERCFVGPPRGEMTLVCREGKRPRK